MEAVLAIGFNAGGFVGLGGHSSISSLTPHRMKSTLGTIIPQSKFPYYSWRGGIGSVCAYQ